MFDIIDRKSKQIIFEKSIIEGDMSVFKKLINHKDVLSYEFHPFRLAVSYKRIDMVSVFILRGVDPSKCLNEAIWLADIDNNHEMVALLWNDQRVKNSLKNNKNALYRKIKKNELYINIENF
jgi:hypothetical protein